MNPTNHTADTRFGGHSRRTVLQALAASGSVAAFGGLTGAVGAQDEADAADDVPVAGEFPAGETVGLRRVAADLPAPTDFDYVEIDGEVRHFVVTQTGQVFATNVHERTAGESTENADDASPDEPDEAGVDDDATRGGEADVDDQDDAAADGSDQDAPADDGAGEFVFNGVIPGWFGMEPAEIDGTENPTLELTAGETYRFTWENGDGQPHNVVILDANDDILERTAIVRELGETQTLEFEATPEMDRYVCEVHPGTMTGRIRVEEAESEADAADEPAEDGDDEPADAPADGGALTPDDMELFLDIGDRLVSLGIGELGGYDERGLLGFALHPQFADNGRFYVRYSAPEREGLGYDHTDVLAEFQTDESLERADPDTERTIMEVPQPQDNHNGGPLAFGPDGYLYASYGDGGNVHDIGIGHVDDWYDENQGGNGQDTTENLLGGVHRIDVDVEEDREFGTYGVPDDNPLVGSDRDRDEYWAWGFRNPWGMSIDDDGRVFVSDAGQHRYESLYAVEAGGNYSWNVKEGSFCFSPASPLEEIENCPDQVPEDADVSDLRAGESLRDPIAEYQHTRISEAFIDSSVVVGGHRYAGRAIPELEDAFVFGNWSSQGVAEADGEVLVAVEPDGDEATDAGDGDLVETRRWDLTELRFEGAAGESLNRYVYSIERDEEGELYVLANTDFRPEPETGEIYKIVPAEEGESVPEPEDTFVVGEGDPEEEAPDDDEEGEAFPSGDDSDGDDETADSDDTEPVDGDADVPSDDGTESDADVTNETDGPDG
ncbi:PQQ-dependent sugar dehydrogenase [Halopiger goleimassiliensis]|uniref:PQQ-dependent sugar dehydrogenase n=1 Tax=Halopiger goleimassiliensis TaxID=1293048 RepID=UPI0009DBADB3|nr:PQQ-dependent sugar dehydrogenase [Halopiger goleimassiliensis]